MALVKVAIALSFALGANGAAAEQICSFNGIKTSVPETVGSKYLSVRLRYSAGARSAYMKSREAAQLEVSSKLNDLQEIAFYSNEKKVKHLATIHCGSTGGKQDCTVNGVEKDFDVPGTFEVRGAKFTVSVYGDTRLVKIEVPKGIAVHATTGWDSRQLIRAKSGQNAIHVNCPAWIDDKGQAQ